jgi:hypothetical protein
LLLNLHLVATDTGLQKEKGRGWALFAVGTWHNDKPINDNEHAHFPQKYIK